MTNPIIYYVDALAGSGKTHSTIYDAIDQARLGRKIAIAQPSKHLISESYNKALDRINYLGIKLSVTRFDSDIHPLNVSGPLTEHLLKTPPDQGEIIFISHWIALNLNYWHNQSNWSLVIDEIISPIEDMSLSLPRNHYKITDLLELDNYNAHYSVLRVSDDPQLQDQFEAITNNAGGDVVDAIFQPITQAINGTKWTLFTQSSNWMAIKSGRNVKDKLLIYGLLNPNFFSGFGETTIMGAMFKDSILYKVWNESVDFKVHQRIQNNLRYQTHDQGSLLTIEYLFDRNWSKSFRDSMIRGSQVMDLAIGLVDQSFNNKDYIFVTNRDNETYLKSLLNTGVKVSNVCHGINEYSHINNAAFLSALNPAPSQFKMLQNLDVSAEELSEAGYLQTVYQAIMRTSLRDPHNHQPKHIIVTDKRAADYLAKVFPGCKVVRNSTLPPVEAKETGRPRTWESTEQREAAKNKRARMTRELNRLISSPLPKMISMVANIGSAVVEQFHYTSNDDLINQLESASHTVVPDKKSNVLLSPAIFNKDKSPDTQRGLANIEYVDGVWLDNDGGDLTWQDFRSIFPTTRMVAFSTFSGGNRYRILIPTTTPMTIEVDYIIKKLIFDELSSRGYAAPGKNKANQLSHGFDTGKLTPSSLFFMPCKSSEQTDSFFENLPGEELNPSKWLTRAPLTMFSEPVAKPAPTISKMEAIRNLLKANENKSVDQTAAIEAAQAEYQSVSRGIGQRNHAFWKLGRDLQKRGLDLNMVEQLLITNAHGDRDRLNQIKSIIKDLKKRPL